MSNRRVKNAAGEKLDLQYKSEEGSFFCLDEETLEEQMKLVAEPMILPVKKSGKLSVAAGELYYELYPQKQPADTVVICHGFTESAKKYEEFIFYLYRAGFAVAIWDQRSHGRSLRRGTESNVVHVEKFNEYVEDMHCMMEQIVKPFAGGKNCYLYAHSMGGCIGVLYLEQYPQDFAKAVLNAPMLAIEMGRCPLFAAKAVCDLAKLFGKGSKRLFTQKDFNPDEPFAESCADSEMRHNYYHAIRRQTACYQTSAASYAWGSTAIEAGRRALKRKNISKIHIPVLLFQAEKDGQVKAAAQNRFVKYLEKGRLVRVEQTKHEIYRAGNAVLKPYMELILDFL